ncbi:hypothetical protein ACFPIF_09905 [Brevundimonas faecalis]|uniref:hypothetical protein n=1 Tax=Brevundimonas faecalis TaxID=947378 RepID=UPI00360D5DF2
MSPARKDKPVSAAVQEAFGRFWAAYPPRRDNPRKPALLAFAALVQEGADADAIIRAAAAFAAHVRTLGHDPKWTPHARTWLAQERFDEWLTSDAPASAQPAGPSPEHPLAALYTVVGRDRWASYFAGLVITHTDDGVSVAAPTTFALGRVRDGWGRDIEALLGRVSWAVIKDRNHG